MLAASNLAAAAAAASPAATTPNIAPALALPPLPLPSLPAVPSQHPCHPRRPCVQIMAWQVWAQPVFDSVESHLSEPGVQPRVD